MGKIVNIVSEISQPIVEKMGLILEDVEFVKEGNNWFLRVFIDNDEEGVSLDVCEEVSKKIGEAMDEADPIIQSYILEVSSPGLERPLKTLAHYDRFVGRLARIKTFAPVEGQKEFIGKLREREGNNIKIALQGEGIKIIPFDKIASGQLIIDFGLHLAGK